MSFKSTKISFNTIATLLIFALFIWGMLSYVSNSPMMIYSSDMITIPYFYKDVFVHHNSVFLWSFPPTPYFFPDILFYSIIALIVRNIQIAYGIMIVLQAVSFAGLLIWVAKMNLKISEKRYSIFIFSILAIFLLFASDQLSENVFFVQTLGGHFSAFLMYLLCLGLILYNFQKNCWWVYGLFSLIIILTTMSDVLFLTQFVVPVLGALVFITLLGYLSIRKGILWILVTGFSAFIGYAIYKYLLIRIGIHVSYELTIFKRYHLHELMLASERMLKYFQSFYKQTPMAAILFVVFFCSSFVYLIKKIRYRLVGQKIDFHNQCFIFTILMLFFTIIVGYLMMVFLDNDLMGSLSLRHIQPNIILPIFLGIPLYLVKFTNVDILIQKYYRSILLSFLICFIFFSPKNDLKNLYVFYPKPVQCIDHYAQEYHLKNGISGYWNAKFISTLSKQNVNVAALAINHNNYVPYLWTDTASAYINKKFNFVLIKTPEQAPITAANTERQFGQPSAIFTCEGFHSQPSFDIFYYKNGLKGFHWTRSNLGF